MVYSRLTTKSEIRISGTNDSVASNGVTVSLLLMTSCVLRPFSIPKTITKADLSLRAIIVISDRT